MVLRINLKDKVGAKALLKQDPIYRDKSKEVAPPRYSSAEQTVLETGGSVRGQSALSKIASANNTAATLKGLNESKVLQQPGISAPALTSWQKYSLDTFKRLGLEDEGDFLKQTGLNFNDTYGKEYEETIMSGGDTKFLDQLIGNQFRTQRDAGLAINSLNSQLDTTQSNLSGGDKYLGLQGDIDKAIQGGATDAQSIANATGLDVGLVNAIQQDNVEGYNNRIGELKTQIDNFQRTNNSLKGNAVIAKRLGISEALAQKISDGSVGSIGVSQNIKNQITKDADEELKRYDEDYAFQKEEANKRLEEYKDDFGIAVEDQKIRNSIIEGNMSRLAGVTGAGFSSRGLGGMEEATRQGISIIEEMQRGYDRATGSVGTYLQELETNFVRKHKDVQNRNTSNINNATQIYLANIAAIKSKFGEVSDAAITQLNDANAKYIENVTNFEQQGLENMLAINQEMRANMQSSIEMQGFQNQESTRIATQLINSGVSMNEVLEMVKNGKITPDMAREINSQMVANTMATLDSIPGAEGLSGTFAKEIMQGIKAGKTPFEVLDEITSSPVFKKAVDEASLDPLKRAQLDEQLLVNQGLKNTSQTTNISTSAIATTSQQMRGKTLLQCGELVNDYWQQMTGSRAGIGNSYDDKVKAINNIGITDGPEPGGLFAFATGSTGHVGIVIGVNEDGSINVLEANREGSDQGGAPVESSYSADQVNNMVFSVPPEPKLSGMTQQVLNGTMKISDVPSDSRSLVANELSTSGKSIVTRKTKEMANGALTAISEIRNLPGLEAAVGQSSFRGLIPGTEAYDARQKINQLKSLTVIPMLEHMKGLGSMSEVEFNTMSKAATALDVSMTEKAFYEELKKIEDGLQKVLLQNGGKLQTQELDLDFDEIDAAVNAGSTVDDVNQDF